MFNNLNLPPWLGVGALAGVLIGIITSFWTSIKSFFWRMVSYAIVHIEIKDDNTGNAVLAYLIQTYPRSAVYDRTYGANHEYTRKDGKYGMVTYEYLGDKTLTFWKGWFPIMFGVSSNASQTNNNQQQNYWWQQNNNSQQKTKTLTYIRGTFDAESIIQSSCDMRNNLSWNTNKDEKKRRFFIRKVPNPQAAGQNAQSFSAGTGVAWYQEGQYRLLQHKPWELGKSQIGDKKALDYLIFPDRIKRLIREIQIWRNNRDWYTQRGLPWKRGWILYGPPGTGKTALVRAFAEDEDMPLFVFSLGEMMNAELQRSWAEMQSHVPCIALFEDIDNVFHGRNNVAGNNLGFGKIIGAMTPQSAQSPQAAGGNQPAEQAPKMGMLSFDCLLNCIDGVEKSDGIFTIITTNDINKIDPALGQPRKLPDGTVEFISSRPGRIDKAIELTYMEHPDKLLMADRILNEYPEGLEQMFEFLRKYPDLQETPAQFQERCSQLALSYFWMAKAKAENLVGYDVATEIHKKVLTVHSGFSPKIDKFVETEIGNVPLVLTNNTTSVDLSAVSERWQPPKDGD